MVSRGSPSAPDASNARAMSRAAPSPAIPATCPGSSRCPPRSSTRRLTASARSPIESMSVPSRSKATKAGRRAADGVAFTRYPPR